MGISFNADEIFEIAEQIERNGVKFYLSASEKFSDTASRNKLLGLAAMEKQHEKTFAAMRAELPVGERMITVFDPENQAALYLRSVAEGKVFDVKRDPSEILSEGIRIEEILQIAIGLEKDSIVFYTGIKEMVPEKLGKGKINDIIKEEIGHINDLSKQLELLRK